MYNCLKGTSSCIFLPAPIKPPYIPHTDDTTFNLLESLEHVYPILEIVFTSLNRSDLINIGTLKKSWQELAERILNKRNKLGWLAVRKNKSKKTFFKKSADFDYNNHKFAFLIFNSANISLNDYFCMHDKNNDLSRVQSLKYLRDNYTHGLSDLFIVGSSQLQSSFPQFVKQPLERRIKDLFECVFLPHIPNVELCRYEYAEAIADLPKGGRVRGALFFYRKQSPSLSTATICKLIDKYNDNRREDFGFGGGIVRRALAGTSERTEYRCMCLAFVEMGESKNFNTASTVLGQIHTGEAFEKQLYLFKSRIIQRENQLIFRFFCNANWRPYNEAAIVERVFPKTIQMAFGVDGEFGWDSYNAEQFDPAAKRARYEDEPIYHEWSTSIVFITWGRIVSN